MGNPIQAVRREVTDWVQIETELRQFEDDPQTLLDTLEGETNLHEALLAIADRVMELKGQAAGVKARIEDLTERKTRLEKSAETLRTVILQAMDTAGLKTVPGDCVTLSMRDTPPGLIVSDEAVIPASYWLPQPPKLDKKALLAALKDKKDAPGAELSNGGISLTMRVK